MKAIFTLGNQNGNDDALKEFLEEILVFSNKCLFRINASRGMEKKDRKAELKAVEEQYQDKLLLFEKKVTSA